MKKKVWIIGAGYMAEEYLKVLIKLDCTILLIGNTEQKTQILAGKYNVKFISGGFEKLEAAKLSLPDLCIIACSIPTLYNAAVNVLELGVKKILCEKPLSFSINEISDIKQKCQQNEAIFAVAYNRRFYSSLENAIKLIQEDGGISSLHFDFSEWQKHYEPSEFNSDELSRNWLIANSTHVIDMAFSLIGRPKELKVLKADHNSLYIGMGISEKNIPFSYHSNWCSGGRWGLEVMTPKRKIILRPLEVLQYQLKHSMEVSAQDKDIIDIDYKPGLVKMVKDMLLEQPKLYLSVDDHLDNFQYYLMIADK